MRFETGHIIGTYRIIRLLGEGGMGAVYEVEHEKLGVHYALKVFTAQCKHSDILKKKFLAEGKALARLRHPNLIRVFDLDIDDATGVLYFVMDIITYKDGSPHTLCDIELEELEEDYILGWFEDLCEVLDYIHSQGIVHRDIKLGNVLLRKDKHVMLSDFGILRVLGEDLAHELNVTKTIISDGKTESKLIMGTDGYMAPEVRSGKDATPAADVYSLGVMFCYLLTGIWYEPGSMALKLLENFNYRWKDVLPQMLSRNPLERPLPLSTLPQRLKLIDSPSKSVTSPPVKEQHPVPKKSSWKKWGVVAVVCGFVSLALLFMSFSSSDDVFPLNIQDDFNELFSSSDIFKTTREIK